MDLYDRDARYAYWLKRVEGEEMDEDSRKDIMEFIEKLEDDGISTLRRIRYITILLLIRRELGKPFREASKDDIRKLVRRLEGNNYRTPQSIETFRSMLKRFYKWLFENDEFYPHQVKWLKRRPSKDIRDRYEDEAEEFLTEEEVLRLIDVANGVMRKAMIATAYETGARPEELLRLRIRDVIFDEMGCVIFLKGKTGQRRVRMVAYAPLLAQWISIHPFKEDRDYPIWISQATNYKGRPLGEN